MPGRNLSYPLLSQRIDLGGPIVDKQVDDKKQLYAC